jgi:peptide deformylase
MAVMPIRVLPDPVLRAVADPVVDFGPDLAGLAADMLETMYAAPGRGLAAPQVGLLTRFFVMDVDWKTGTPASRVFANPVILTLSDDQSVYDEGCLSIPGTVCPVARPAGLTLRWQGLDGAVQTGAFDGFAARCIQHETDHLDGVLCIDYPAPALPDVVP